MAMREDCKHFQSRTYANGEAARYCSLDLAPDSPWKCPTDCASYHRRMADVAWVHQGLVSPPVEELPAGVDLASAEHLLEEAERIVDNQVPAALEEVARSKKSWLGGMRMAMFRRERGR